MPMPATPLPIPSENIFLPENTVLLGNCIKLMNSFPPASVDMIFADPPYNLQIGPEHGCTPLRRPNHTIVDGVNAAWDKLGDFADHDRFTIDWLVAARRILKPDGTLWVIGSYHNIYRVGALLQNIGFWMLNDVIWRKTNPMPNFRGRRMTNAHETLLWAAQNRNSRYCFNHDALKMLNEGLQMRSDWLLPICGGSERLRDEHGYKQHPTQKPESLLYRVISTASSPGDLILDPFFGTGTTGVVAKRLGRRWLGLEQDPDYAILARDRIAATLAEDPNLLHTPSRRKAPRVPFGSLLERGLLAPGEILFDERCRVQAKIHADGALTAIARDGRPIRGSIHSVSAEIQGAPTCNGWTFWWLNRNDKLIPLDQLRQQVQAELLEMNR